MVKVRSSKEVQMTRLNVILAAAVLFAGPAYLFQKPLANDDGEIRVTARKYEFIPKVIKVKRGDHIRLVVTALDRNHGFKLEAFRIDLNLTKGKAVAVEFTADLAGTFPFECSHFCGLGHQKMKGQLTVE
jgi:heme/copper-type cytochrome/quinol oxidase subunit 2